MKKRRQEQTFSSQLALTVKSRMLLCLREELGLGKQPRAAKMLVDELYEIMGESYRGAWAIGQGQVVVIVPEAGEGAEYKKSMEDCRMVTVLLNLFTPEDIEVLVSGNPFREVRLRRLCRIVCETYAQGGTMTVTQLGLLTSLSPSLISFEIREYMKRTGETLPLRGIIEDIGRAVSHKALVIQYYQQGMTTSEIARKTNHSPRSVERYIKRFNQVQELLRYLEKSPEPDVIARILGCGKCLVEEYLKLISTGLGEKKPGS